MSYENARKQLRALTKAFQDRVDGTIYHYTSAEGFRGIVTSGEVWLTSAAFVNDTTECGVFWECAKDLQGDRRLSNQFVRDKLELRLEDRPQNHIYYVASFSTVPNSLQQYRAYGGFCIGFDPRRMARRAFDVYRCVYKGEDIKAWICRKSKLRQWQGSSLDDQDKRAAAHDLVFSASVKQKNHHYQDEAEVRLVAVSYPSWEPSDILKGTFPVSAPAIAKQIHSNDPPIHFRDHPMYRLPVPYVKFFVPLDETADSSPHYAHTETLDQMKRRRLDEENKTPRGLLPITELWVGPMAREQEASLASEIMLQANGYERVPVKVSDIPYRGG